MCFVAPWLAFPCVPLVKLFIFREVTSSVSFCHHQHSQGLVRSLRMDPEVHIISSSVYSMYRRAYFLPRSLRSLRHDDENLSRKDQNNGNLRQNPRSGAIRGLLSFSSSPSRISPTPSSSSLSPSRARRGSSLRCSPNSQSRASLYLCTGCSSCSRSRPGY